jgi:hypothetical protein
MQLVPYDTVMRRTLSRLGEDYDGVAGQGTTGPDGQRWRDVRDAVAESLERWWLCAWWPSICRTEQRPLRAHYSPASAYEAGTEVFYQPTCSYYHAVRTTAGAAPATYADGEWTTNFAYWAKSARLYSAADYSDTTAYVAGDQVFYPLTAKWYQCHTAATGELPTDTDFWGELVEFIPTLPRTMAGYNAIGHVRSITHHDPRRFIETPRVDFNEVDTGWQVHEWVNHPWVTYRLRCPRLEGLAYDATATYTPEATEDASWSLPIAYQEGIQHIYNTTTGLWQPVILTGSDSEAQIGLGPGVSFLVAPSSSQSISSGEDVQFATVDAMKTTLLLDWARAACLNLEAGDGNWSYWVRTAETGLDATNPAIAELSDGSFARRLYP